MCRALLSCAVLCRDVPRKTNHGYKWLNGNWSCQLLRTWPLYFLCILTLEKRKWTAILGITAGAFFVSRLLTSIALRLLLEVFVIGKVGHWPHSCSKLALKKAVTAVATAAAKKRTSYHYQYSLPQSSIIAVMNSKYLLCYYIFIDYYDSALL